MTSESPRVEENSFEAMIERGLADANAGRTISNDEMLRRIRSWVLDKNCVGEKILRTMKSRQGLAGDLDGS